MARTILNKPETAGVANLLQKIHYFVYRNNNNVGGATEQVIWRTGNFTTTTTDASLIVSGQFWGIGGASDQCGAYVMLTDGSGNDVSGNPHGEVRSAHDDNKFKGVWYAGVNHSADWATFLFAWHKAYTGVAPGTYRVEIGHSTHNNAGGNHPMQYIDPNGDAGNTDNRCQPCDRQCMVWECKPGDGVTEKNNVQNNY